MSEEYVPGPRQTVDRCLHPTLGEGVAVYDNGPAWFRADSGEVVPMRSISLGGCGVGGSWLQAVASDGHALRLDTTGRMRGTSWERAVGQQHGAGWLGRGGRKHPTSRAMWLKFEPDIGVPIEMWIDAMWVGLPKHDTITRRLSKKVEKALQEERKSCPWLTMKANDGSTFVCQREADYVADTVAAPTVETSAPKQMGLL